MAPTYLREFSERSLSAIALALAAELPVQNHDVAVSIIVEQAASRLPDRNALRYLRNMYEESKVLNATLAAQQVSEPAEPLLLYVR